ncbi:MAG: DUF465 domain-containing protein [Alphaproteobacteria bacterium]|nr:DUF465 domain-containing protein [Alphaproteobacteria bacterium]
MSDKIQNHLNALKAKHAELDVLIAEENAHPHPDDTKIHEYKKQKLKVKEEIEEIEKNM